MLFKTDYTAGKTHASGDFIVPCGNYASWGSDFVMRLTMGEVVPAPCSALDCNLPSTAS